MSKEPDWRKAYAESAETWKETEDWEGLSPSLGQGSYYPAVSAAPRRFCSFSLTRSPGTDRTLRQREMLLATLDTQPGTVGHIPWSGLACPLPSPSL